MTDFSTAHRAGNLHVAKNLLVQIERSGQVAPSEIYSCYVALADLARKKSNHAFAADHYMYVIERDAPDSDNFQNAANALQRTLHASPETGRAIRSRYEEFIKVKPFPPAGNRDLRYFIGVFVIGSRLLKTFPNRLIDLGSDIACLTSIDLECRRLVAEEVLFRGRANERMRGATFDRGKMRVCAELVVENKGNFADDQECFHTKIVGLAHFEFLDLLDRFILGAALDEKAARLLSMQRSYREFEQLSAKGDRNAAKGVLEGVAPHLEGNGNKRTASAPTVIDTEIEILRISFLDAICRFYESGLSLASLTECGPVLRLSADDAPRIALILDRQIKESVEALNRVFLKAGLSGSACFLHAAEFSAKHSAEAGRVNIFSRPNTASMLVAIKRADGYLLYELPIKHLQLYPPKFEGNKILLSRYFLLCGLSALAFGLAGKVGGLAVKSPAVVLGEVDKQVDQFALELARREVENLNVEFIRYFLNLVRGAEEGLMAVADQISERRHKSMETVDLLFAPSMLAETTVKYQLAGGDFLRGSLRSITVRHLKSQTFEVAASLAEEGTFTGKEIHLLVDLDKAAVKIIDTKGIREDELALGVFEEALVELTAGVLARYLCTKVVTQRYSGYLIMPQDGGTELLSPIETGKPGLTAAELFVRGFDHVLRTKGILGLPLFRLEKGYFGPLELPGNITERERSISGIAREEIFAARQYRGRLCRLPVKPILMGDGSRMLAGCHHSNKAQIQKTMLGDQRELSIRYGIYIITTFSDGSEHVLPVHFRNSQHDLLSVGREGTVLVDEVSAALAKGKYRDPEALLRSTKKGVRGRYETLMRAGDFTQRVEIFDVEETYRRPDFISVAELLAEGYSLRPKG